ncbi:hypothetical protein Afil01_56040 [Actinorhabdospora filicis]|uniref:Type VII secretion system protein EssD-like domain-containing protein n=1 Tax=Actinorhabdospora filicis TaxID=1785913 RepID=A0A9W6W5V0_9ACTN|nr:DNA/RNA non-specific endonuclease [Actinorhabdospora filicis]GLZ80797.1 hypothetical protein Afil01_56040 [Actinorhabdospora filicis]
MHEYEIRPEHAAPARAKPRMSTSAPMSILDLQKAAGNKAVSNAIAVQRKYTGKPYIEYGGLYNGSGTIMHAELHPGKLPEGSVPSVVPPWWPDEGTAARKWTAAKLVQGHLLNHNIGGPGNTMKNMTPITRSTNSTHLHKVETFVKKALLQDKKVVEYEVSADYSGHPTSEQLGSPTSAIYKAVAPGMAKKIVADYTLYEGGKDAGGGRWEIANEIGAFKGDL